MITKKQIKSLNRMISIFENKYGFLTKEEKQDARSESYINALKEINNYNPDKGTFRTFIYYQVLKGFGKILLHRNMVRLPQNQTTKYFYNSDPVKYEIVKSDFSLDHILHYNGYSIYDFDSPFYYKKDISLEATKYILEYIELENKKKKENSCKETKELVFRLVKNTNLLEIERFTIFCKCGFFEDKNTWGKIKAFYEEKMFKKRSEMAFSKAYHRGLEKIRMQNQLEIERIKKVGW